MEVNRNEHRRSGVDAEHNAEYALCPSRLDRHRLMCNSGTFYVNPIVCALGFGHADLHTSADFRSRWNDEWAEQND